MPVHGVGLLKTCKAQLKEHVDRIMHTNFTHSNPENAPDNRDEDGHIRYENHTAQVQLVFAGVVRYEA